MRLTRTETTERDTGEDNDRQGNTRARQNQKQGDTAVTVTYTFETLLNRLRYVMVEC